MTLPCRLAVVLALLASPALAGAQPPGIRGRVVAAETGAPLPGAAVTARAEADTAVVARAESGADGRFRLAGLPAGRYVVRAAAEGRQPATAAATVAAAGAQADAGDLRLARVVTLEGLEARAERPPVVHAEDRTIYNVQDLPSASTAAADVMRTIPELEVDLDGNVTLVGNRAAVIHINGRPSPLRGDALKEFLKNLPAERIERVEVIPNPSVRYEGGGAIVNIVLKKGVQLGLSGSLSANAATRGGSGLSGQLAYQRGRLTVFGGGSQWMHRYDNRSSEVRQNLLATPVTFLDVTRADEGESGWGGGDLTAELEVGPKETVWASVGGYLGSYGGDGTSHNRLLDAERDPTRIYDRLSDSDADSRSTDVGVGFRRIVEAQRHELTLEVRRSGSSDERAGRFEETTTFREGEPGELLPELRLTGGEQHRTSWMAKADYVRPVGRGGRVEVGVRAQRDDATDRSLMRVFAGPETGDPVESVGHAYRHREEEDAAYLNASQTVGRVTVQAGLRAENSLVTLTPRGGEDAVRRDYFAVFPSANVRVELGEGRDLRLSYSKRVRRPWIWYLNPFVPQTDPLNVWTGNPDLEPTETHALGLDLTVRTGSGLTLRLAPYFRRTTDEVEYLRTVDAAGVATSTPQNLATVESFGSTLNASLRPTEWSNLSATVGFSHLDRDAGNLSEAYSGSASSQFFSANATLQPGWGLGLQGSLRLSSPRETAQGRYSSTVMSDLGVRKDLFEGRSSIHLRVSDPFDVFRSTFRARDPSFATTGQSRSSWSGRSASLSFTYRFGNAPKRKSPEAGGGGGAPGPGGGGPPAG